MDFRSADAGKIPELLSGDGRLRHATLTAVDQYPPFGTFVIWGPMASAIWVRAPSFRWLFVETKSPESWPAILLCKSMPDNALFTSNDMVRPSHESGGAL